jgi:peptidoglycan/LPS O-acetylase OafA/YrhL
VLFAVRFFSDRFGLLLLALVGAAVSAFLMAQLYHPGMLDPTRIYEGTDTRAFELLIGAALACVRPTAFPRFRSRTSVRRLLALDVAGAAGLVAIFVLVTKTTFSTASLTPTGSFSFRSRPLRLLAPLCTRQARLPRSWGPGHCAG